MPNQDAQYALREMRNKEQKERGKMKPDPNDPGTVMAHNMAMEGTPPLAATLAGTARNMVSPQASIQAIWELLFGPQRQGQVQGGPESLPLAENTEKY